MEAHDKIIEAGAAIEELASAIGDDEYEQWLEYIRLAGTKIEDVLDRVGHSDWYTSERDKGSASSTSETPIQQ